MIEVDVVYTNDATYRNPNSLPTAMPAIFQNFEVEELEEVTRNLDWPVEATKAEITLRARREAIEIVRAPAKTQEGYEGVE